MRRALMWSGNVVGGFAAGFLAYVVAGSLLGRAIAVPFDGHQGCWPTMLSTIAVHCENGLAGTFWFGTVQLPTMFAFEPVRAYLLLTASGDAIADDGGLGVRTGIVVLLAATGFHAWRTRAPIIAWALAVGLIAEVIFGIRTNTVLF